jgi:predicted site-specific integrase-resolvase
MPRKASLNRKNRDLQTLTKDNRVFLYIRASTPEQVNSLDAQAAAAARFADRHELLIHGTETDAGVSAIKHGFRDRPGAQRMFRTMKGRGIRTILVLRVDRAFRSSLDFSQTLAWCRDEGFTFRFIDPDIDLGTPIGEMFIQIQVALAQMECDIRSSRVDGALDSLRSHRLSRNGSAAPYGWQAIPCTDGTTTRQGHGQYRHLPIPAEQAVLRHLLELWELHQGHGALTRIAAIMNDLGIPTKMAGQSMTKHGRTVTCSGLWFPATVKSVLEHAVPATDAELLDGIPSLDQAIAILRQTSPTSPTRPTSSSPLVSCVLQS